MENLFTFFFKYRPFFFQRGEFTFQWGLSYWTIGLLIVSLAALLFLVYRHRLLQGKGTRTGWGLLALRCAFFLVLFLLCMRPGLVLSRLVPKENLLAILVDNSRSMGIPTDTNQPRDQKAQEQLTKESDVLKALDEKFHLRLFQFESLVLRVEEPAE